VTHADNVDPSTWIRRYTAAKDAPTRLVCFPHAGGSASFFHPLAIALPTVDVISLQYPGRQDRRREPVIPDIAGYADQITTVLATLPSRPTVFFGHSMGATLAFEVAHRLENSPADAPKALVVSGRRGPSTYRDESVHLRDDNGIVEEMKLLNGTNLALLGDEEILRMALPAIRSDYRAIETYTCQPGRLVHVPITALIGDSDPRATVDEATNWQEHTTAEFRLRTFTGGHFYLTDHQAALTAEISAELAKLAPARAQT
jgi:surfactin synthase thioesterase subunit